MTALKDIVLETDHHWVKRVPKGFEVYKTGLTHSTRVAIIGYAGDKGLQRAKDEIARREAASAPSERHHATKKSPAQLQREIDEALVTPAWAKGLDLSESRALAKRLGTVDVEAKQRRNESDRRAALPSLAITDTGNGIFVRVSSPGPGYGKYHAAVDALKAFQIPIGNAIPPNIFVPVHKAADKTKARTQVEEALRYAGYRV
jgi:hypothetical protein